MIDFTQFQKPQRYIGNEWNAVKKPLCGKIKICIAYPEIYEIGMSNLGLRIVYGLLNEYPDVACERVFSPAEDLAAYLKKENKALFSLETKTPLKDFEVLGFHLGCELNFTNVLRILDLGQIEIKACQRKDIIVIGGGIANPEPLAEFIDVFYLGEFEPAAESFIEVLRHYKDKVARLRALANLKGFYVPAIHQSTHRVKRGHLKKLEEPFYLERWLTPHTQIVHDRVPIEIARGCPNACTFCQARAVYAPYRERKPETVQKIMEAAYQNSGYENFSFLALSASDYSQIEELIDSASEFCRRYRIGLSLPSLRATDICGRLYKKLSQLKKASLTVAVEAAGEHLRAKLNKKVDLKAVFEAVKILESLKASQIKIYFMYGFPDESDQDLAAIGDLLKRLSATSRLKLNISINAFIPKPFSLAEKAPMQKEEVLKEKQKQIINNLPRQRNNVYFSSIQSGILEAIISRAGREFSKVIYRAFLKGAYDESLRENFSWNIWQKAMEEEGIDYHTYLKAEATNFPWSFIK